VDAAIVVTGSLTKEFEVVSGKSYEGTIDVLNPDQTPQEVKAYQTDYSFSSDGKVVYGDPGSVPRSNTRWITLSPNQVTIPPGKTVTVHFAVDVPSDPTMKGTYWSVIMIEPVPEGSAESSRFGPPTMAIQQVFRFAVQVVANVGTTGARQLKFHQVKLTDEKGKVVLDADVSNTGERWLRGSLWIELYDANGVSVGKFDGGTQRMYPGTSVRFTSELTGLKNASYKALIVVDCGGDDVFGAQINVALP